MRTQVRTLPGFFRPTKNWDFVITHRGQLVAVLEMKSQVGSFGNNFNNRCEEAIGSAADFQTAFRDGAFGPTPRKPFIGYLMLVEDCPKSRRKLKASASVFPAFPVFAGTSYIDRYQILCKRLVAENLYTAATVLTSPTNSLSGKYAQCCESTGIRRFVADLAGAVAVAAAESGGRPSE